MSDIQNGNVNTFTPVEAFTEVDPVVAAFQAGGLIVYPAEAVMGIGYDPDIEAAVNALLNKTATGRKGVILIAANYSQLLPYVNDNAIRPDRRTDIFELARP